MALIKCPDCGTQISDSAPSCPKCGRPAGAPIKGAQWWQNPPLWRFLAVVALAFIILRACGIALNNSGEDSGSIAKAKPAIAIAKPADLSSSPISGGSTTSVRASESAQHIGKTSEQSQSKIAKISDKKCKKNLDCAGAKYQPYAEAYCKPLISSDAKYDAKWNSFFMPIFDSNAWAWANKSHSDITYVGEGVKFQNAYGVYIPMAYACTINIASLHIVTVKVVPQ